MEQSSFPVSGDVNSTFPSNTSFDSENSDYSSDSSVASNSALVRRPAFTAPVTLSDGSMITAAATNHSQSDVVSAQPYKFFTYTPESDATQDPKTCEFLEREQVELCALKDLVCFSASELYDRAWLTADFNERCKSFPPFPILPQPPNVFGARFENTHNISHFLYHFTPFLLERNHAPTPVYLRTKLVELSLGEETLRMKQSLVSTSVNAVPQGPPDWETEAGEHKDLDEETSSEDDNTEVTPFDVGVALSHSTLMSQMPLDTVILLDKLVNRCIRRATMSMFHTWGIKRVTNILLRQVETLSTQAQPDIDWLSRAYSLIAKIVLSSGDVNKLLTIIRWNYQHPNVLRQLKVRGLRNLVNLIAWSDVARVRLPLPYNVPRGDVISYSHSLGSFINKIYAICACEEVEKPFVSVFADTGVYSISVRPPFEILHRNLSYSGEGCKGVYLKDGVFSVIRSSGVEFLSAATLEKMPQTVANPDADGEHFSLFTGSGRYLRPFVRAGGSPRRLRFKGSCGEGRVEPPNVVIPRGTDSITVQFSFYAYKPALTTKVEVVSILAGEKKWLSASVTMCPNKSTVTVLFEHGEDAFAEVEEPIKNGWVTWNASLVSLNEITSWTVYRNGLFCESRGKSGTLFTPSMPGVLDILAGSFFGFFSDVSVWCCPRRLTGEPDAPHAQSSSSSTSSSLPLFRFPLDEGVGFTVRSSCGECSWSSKLLQWEVPPESEKIVSGKESRRMEWKPSGDYYCVHNGFEVCVVEDDCATWVDAEGMIVEQNEVKIKPTDCCFYSLSTGKLYLVLPEVSSIRIVARICPASQSLEKKETLRSYQSFCVAFLSSLEDQKYSTGGAEFSQYIAYQISAYLLLEDSKNRDSFFSFPSLNTPCVKTVTRLIVICNDVVEKIKCDAASGIDELHLCICGRLLVKQVKLLERTCPKTAISQIIDIYNYLSNLGPSKDKFLDEAVGVFVHLHNVMLSNCLSHDYQLQLLCDCSNLHGVRQLLTPGNVQQLVLSVIKYDFKKPFMTLLGKLKKMCEEEADNIFARRKTGYFEAAPALLSCVLGLLTQRESTQWHLVSVALFSSLCKNIVKGYEKAFESETDRRANTNLLKQTSLGALVYPVAHVLYSARFDASITLDILKVLGEARAALVPYYTTYVKPSVFKTQTSELVVSNETHVVLFPFNTTIPASATVDMSYGKSIVVEASEEARQACEIEVVLIATYSRHRLVEVLGDSDVRFDCGGLLTITVKGKELPFPICVNVHVEVERQRELDSSTDWLRDISHCLTHSIVNVATHAVEELRLNSPSSSEDFITKYSLFAGGLYANFTKVLSDPQHAATSAGKTRLPQVTAVRAKIIALSINEESPLTALWHEQFNATAFPQRERLAELVRQCTCAILWFTVNPYAPQNWETEVVTVLNYLKRKSYLLLECMQQGRTPSIMSRVEFLLRQILPHFSSEDFSYANQFGDSSRPAQQSRTMSRRGASTSVSHSRPVEPLTLSIDPQRSTTSKVKADPLSAGKASETTEESIANEILVFLRDETLEDTEQITEELNRRTLVCLILTATFKLKTAVCECNRDGVSLFLFSLTNHLQFLQRLSTRDGNTAATTASHEDTPHYLSCIKGCGIMIESECQRSGAAFFCAAVRQLVKRLGSEAHVCLQSIISLCSALAHPWDSKDFTVMPPSELFEFFSLSLQKVDEIMVALKSSEERFYNRKGFLHLLKRCMVLPNSLLQVAGDGIQIINGEVQGLQAENVNVICCARNNWKPQYGKAGKMKRRKGSDTDVYSNYGLSCVFTEVPDVLYFEITVDLCTNDAVRVTCGLSSVPLASTETELPDSCVYFSSDGYVTDGSAKRKKFSDPWVVGDVIGCGLLAPDNGIFFTRNGTFLGVAVESSFETFTPFVEAKAVGSLLKIIVNFGAEQPFKFDLASMHCSCRSDYLTPKLVSDAVLMCIHFFISNANTVFQEEYDSRKDGEREACAAILHAAAKFLSESVLTTVGEVNAMMGSHAESTDADTFALDYYLDKLGKLFQLLDSLVECFVYDSVGRATYAIVIDVCVTTLMRSREKSSRFRATHTFGLLLQMVDPASISATIVSQKISISAEEVVQCLSELARTNLVKGAAASSLPPQWANETSTVSGKGVFFGLQPLPAQGTTVIGFKLQRRQRGQGVGTPLGGCYYIGLCHGRPHIPNMGSLISRSDVYVLQDTDDHDQVQHLLLRRHSIPRNDNRRIFGNDEVVWVEFNADTGEITYYRDNMVLIGLAFANIQKVDDLYPIVYMFNEDASCELIHFPTSNQESSRQWLESFRRSLCVSTLQQMHLVPYFAPVISQFIYRHLSLLDRDLQSCMVALAVLGGERSYKYCLHDTFGLVVVVFIADVISKAVVYVATDVNKHLFSVPLRHLKPTFVKIPLHSSMVEESSACAGWLVKNLRKCISDAVVIAPLLHEERNRREQIEDFYTRSFNDLYTLDFVGYHSAIAKVPNAPTFQPSIDYVQFKFCSADMIEDALYTVERHSSSPSLYLPSPLVAVTTDDEDCFVVRCAPVTATKFWFAVSINSEVSGDQLLYVGVTASTSALPKRCEEVALWEDSWPLCSVDSTSTNSVNCILEPLMIFNGDSSIFLPGDVLLVGVNRLEGTVEFSRVRQGGRIDFGVLFDSVPDDVTLRPFVVCGPQTVAVFSLKDGLTFPSRDIYPSSHFNSVVKDATSCSVCDQLLTAPWFATEDKTTLCTNCFTSWRKPKELFYVGRAPTNACEVPKYIVCRNAPHSLKVGGYVEFDENFTLTWSPDRSVNCEVVGTAIVAEAEESFGVTEPLPLYGVSRADVVLDHIAGVPGFPFSGLCPFKPLWKEGSTKSQCSLTCDTLNVSCTTFPRNTKAMVVLDISPALGSPPILFSQVFLGVSTLTDNSYHIFQADMDKLCANNSLWGTWCDSKEKVSPEGRVYLVVDNIAGNLYMSSTIADLSENPVVVACGWPTDDNFYLRLCVYSQAEGGSVTSTEGCFSSSTPSETSLTTVAIGLFPEKGTDLADPSFVESEVVLFDTVQGTELISQAQWKFNNEALSGEVDAAFRIGDTLTFVRRNATLTLYCQGHLLATTVVSPDVRYRVIVYLSCPGLTAKVCAPVMGRAHLGKVVRVYGGEIGTVEYNSNDWEKRYFTVRRKDVRFCALAASQYAAKDLRENATVVFKSSGFQAPKRGTLVSIASNGMSLNVTALDDPRTVLSLKLDQCFVLDNEGPDASNSTLYPLISPPMSTVTTLFEVGKSRSNSQNKGSYNGIIFDCKASNSIDLVGLSCLSRTTGRHHVDIFYKKGSHYKFESEPKAWSNVYSGMVEMQVDAQFQISFAPIHIEPSSTFSLYVNSSHNCSVGFFGEEDGGRGEIGQEFDSDGTITVFLGKKSTSSVPFGDFSLSTRGFCGTLMYRQNKGSRLPLLECPANTEAVDRLNAAPLLGDVQRLVSRPMCHAVAPRISFHLTVTGPPISVDEIRLPILLEKTRRDAPSIGASHCVVSVFMSRVCELGDSESYTRWCWNTKVPLTDHVTIATLSGKPVYLEKGIYVFLLVADTHDREDINCYFIDAKGSNYRKENSLFAVENFFGDVYGQLDISCFSGDKYTLTTGAYLNQRSSASYNGIMFDLRSKENITLEEIFCLSQTTAECVSVTVFWKEGSMKDMERQPSQWKEVASKDMALFDKLPFSVGGLYLPMKANTTYAIYVNTSSSCGVRFFNNNDGDLGSFGDELESDGVLTVYVGRKSESSRPFAEIPLEARAFRGKIVYRKLTQGALDGTSCALFPYMKAFIITRILVALIAFVESQSGDADESQFPYTELFSTISVLLPSSGEMLVGLELAEDTLQNVLRTTPLEELQASIVSVSLFPHDTAQTLPVCKGDTVLVYRPETVSYDTATAMEDGFASGMCRIECGGQETPVPVKHLVPALFCHACKNPFASAPACGASGHAHSPPATEKERLREIVAGHLKSHSAAENSKKAADTLLGEEEAGTGNRIVQHDKKTPLGVGTPCVAGGKVSLEFSLETFLTEETGESNGFSFNCPFVFVDAISSHVSLFVKINADHLRVSILSVQTDPAGWLGRCFRLSLSSLSSEGDQHSILSAPILLQTHNGKVNWQPVFDGNFDLPLLSLIAASSTSVHLVLEFHRVDAPTVTPCIMDAQDGVWNWEGGETLALLDGSEPCVLDCVFDNAKWGDRPRFCPFTVCNRQKSESVFLELHVVEGTKNAAHYGRWQEKGRPKAIVRKPFCVFSDESLTMGFSHEGEFFLVDEEDVVRCLITAGELRSAVKSGAPRRVGFISVDPEVSIRLGSIKGVRSNFLSDRKVVMPSSSLFTPTIQLKWNAFDESRVSVSENRRTASCCSTFGGQAVLGTPLPSTGVSAFLIYWDRSGASSGVSLGSGHFTGVAVEGFSDTAPLYSDMKNLTGTVWAVQDLTDGDSMTNQLFIPPTEEGSRVVYGTGTKLLFILDRSACTLSLARDNESPRVVFKDIPKDVVLCPFVRIDNTASFATLASFSQQYNELYHPPSANSLAAQPLTASWVRRFPLVQVANRFPILRYILGALPLSKAAAFEACWGDLDIKTRFDYHVKKAVEALVELGCLTAEADVDLFLQEDAFRRILSALQSPVAESHIIFAHHHVEYTFELDRAYEVVHLVPEHGMAQLLYFDPQTATCTESTFIMVASSEVNVDALCSSSLVPHFMVVTEQRLLRPLFAATDDVCGFVVDGWYNSRLSCRDVSTLSESDTRKIALSLVYGLEHWHLHGVAHTGVCAANLLLSVDRDEVVKCVLWNGVLSAPPMLGVCDSVFREDLCGCVRVLESLPLLPGIEASSEKFLQYLQNGEFSLTEALRETDLFLDRRVESDESPATVFRTGAKLRGGSGSYNGIMFDLVAKENPLRILKLSFLPDITTTAVVSVFTRDGGFMGVEEKRSCWRKVFEKPLSLYDNTEVVVEDFTEQICIAAGSRTGIFLHTTSGSGVLYYSRSEGVRAEMGHVEESNGDIGITVGKKSESNQPFVAIQNQERLLKGSVTYALIKRSNGPRSSLLYSADERRLKETVKERRMSWAPPQPVRIHGGLEGFRTLSLDEKDLILRENGGMEWFSKASVHDMILRDGDDLVGALDSLLQKMRLELDASQVSGWQYEKLPFRAVGEAGGESRFASDSLSPCDQIISITTHGQAVMRVCLFTEGNEECMDWIECKNSLFLLFDAGSLVLLLDDRRPLCEFNVSDHAYHLVIASPGSTKMGSFVAYRATRAAVTGVRLSDHEAVICDLSDHTVRVHLWCVTVEALSDGDGRSVQCRLSFPVSFQIQMDATFTNAEGAPETVSYLLEEHGEDHLVVEFKVCKAKPLFLRIRPVLPVAHPTLTFAAPTQGVKVVSDRVSQVAHFNGEPLKCMVCTPRLCSREAHSIKLLLWFPQNHPIGIFLTTQSSLSVNLEYARMPFLRDRLLSRSGLVSLSLTVLVDLMSGTVSAQCDSGTVCLYENMFRHGHSDLQLSFVLSAPGSTVEVASWGVLNLGESAAVQRQPVMDAVSRLSETGAVSFNYAPTTGTIIRHSVRDSHGAFMKESNGSCAKQMEFLLLSYSRLLLGKALFSQEKARESVADRLHKCLSYTSLTGVSSLSNILDSESRKRSHCLLSQCFAYLLLPDVLQETAGVSTSLTILDAVITDPGSFLLSATEFSTALILVLLRTATVQFRSTRHLALTCVQKLVSNPAVRLPCTALLVEYFRPVFKMIVGLCKRDKMTSAVVQIGVTLLADLYQRCKGLRDVEMPLTMNTTVPFHIVVCARVIMKALLSDPPSALPYSFSEKLGRSSGIFFELLKGLTTTDGNETLRVKFTSQSEATVVDNRNYEIELAYARKGKVFVGWDATAKPDEDVPYVGYQIDVSGDIYVFKNGTKSTKPLNIRARGGERIVVHCFHARRIIEMTMMRGASKELATRFDLAAEEFSSLSVPFVLLENAADAQLHLQSLGATSYSNTARQLFYGIEHEPNRLDSVAPQSHSFYTELNFFLKTLSPEVLSQLQLVSTGSPCKEVRVGAHELAEFQLLTAVVNSNVYEGEISLGALAPYVHRLGIFDAVTMSLAPLLNLRRQSELLNIFRFLKNLCSPETEKHIQSMVMKPFLNRAGKKAHVTLHTMQAQMSPSLGPYPTLMSSLFGQLYVQLHQSSCETYYASPMFFVKLAGFGSTDAGGPYRDALSQLATEIMTRHPSKLFQLNPLFAIYGNGSAVMPNTQTLQTSQTSLMLEFLGKLFASFFVTNDILAVELSPLFWKLLVGEKPTANDLVSLDSTLKDTLDPVTLLQTTETDLEDRFPGVKNLWSDVVANHPSLLLDVQLPPDDMEGAELLARCIVENTIDCFRVCIDHMRRGFHQVLPLYTLEAFRWQTVELAICGAKKLSFEAFKRECDIQLGTAEADMFLEVLQSMTDEDRALLLRFITGQSRLPLKSRIKIQSSGTKNTLPTSSTCFFTFRVPSYTSSQIMMDRLLYAARQCKAIDADGQARENLILNS